MNILPVLDLMEGKIVRGVGGRRHEYRPVVSRLVPSAEPLVVAEALHADFGFAEFYLADLDAIQGGRPSFEVYTSLQQAGFCLWIDAGIQSEASEALLRLRENDSISIVVGLETLEGPAALQRIVAHIGAARIIFSLDLKDGQQLGRPGAWPANDAWSIAQHAVARCGVGRMIVLDLARVGVGRGVGTEELCKELKTRFPDLQLTAGGGVRSIEDVHRLARVGVNYALVASALHDGLISPDQVKQL